MKVDRNQNVCAYQQNYIEYPPEHEFGVSQVQTIGGIPLRLELAARFMAGELGRDDCTVSDFVKSSRWNLQLADALIEAHNATCGEVASE